MFGKLGKYIWTRVTSVQDYWLTRFVILRVLGFVYFFAFVSLATQVIPLMGENGLLPADAFLETIRAQFPKTISLFGIEQGPSTAQLFFELPTIFWFGISDAWMLALSWFGVALSLIVLVGFANVPLLFLLWLMYLSFVNTAQRWLSYGWEMQLLETGFLAMFLVPLLDPRPFPKFPPPVPAIWLMRWLAFRIHLGAGLIKLRGDECWRNLTCLFTYYETQPIPNPLSPWLHFAPKVFHIGGVLFNHFVELVVPWFIFVPWRKIRHLAGLLSIGLQVFLILSGNLAFINWITIVPFLAVFDDSFWRKVLPGFIVRMADKARGEAVERNLRKRDSAHYAYSLLFSVAVLLLSVPVILNLLSSRQMMNFSFNRFHLVNTYGAFGSVGKERLELVVQGTEDLTINENTTWQEYEFKAKPTDLKRRLPVIAPYQPRVDWQIWFAAMSNPDREPWLIHFVWKLLHDDQETIGLIRRNPFSDAPPQFIKIDLYTYNFVEPWKKKQNDGAVWKRTYRSPWLLPVSKDTLQLQQFIAAHGWQK